MRSYFMIFAALLLLFGCIEPPTPVENETNDTTPVITPVEGTTLPSEEPEEPEPYVLPPDYSVNLGDWVLVNYTLFVNGEVVDTNNASLAQEAGIFNPYRNYEPLAFQVVFGEGMIDGFVFGVIGMEINETLSFAVEPERGYGPYDPTKVVTIDRYYNMSLYEVIPRAYLEDQGINITNGTGFETAVGTVFIDSYNDENVTLFYILSPGDEFVINGLQQRVVSLYNLTATIEFMLEENESYQLPNPQTGMISNYKVINKTDTNITLDSNHPLANETLEFEVTLIDAVPYKD